MSGKWEKKASGPQGYSKYHLNGYNYNFLKTKIKKACRDKDIKVLCVGVSYSMFGLIDKEIQVKALNLSLPSQDFYFAYKIASRIIELNKSIEYCIIGSAYYSFHFDLAKFGSEGFRVERVYYPVLGDTNGFKLSEAYDRKRPFNVFGRLAKTYFNITRTRKDMRLIDGELCSFDKQTLITQGRQRAETHNKLIKYEQTAAKYEKLLADFLEMLQVNQIKPIIMVFPATKYYREPFDKGFKTVFYNSINSLLESFNFEVIDLFSSDQFELRDYVDFDHLGLEGAKKATRILNEHIK